MAEQRKLPSRQENYSEWYNQVVLRAELADYSPVRGCMVIRPYGYALWENIRDALDRRFKATGHVNAYFPLFIPMSFIEKEKEHVEGFAPELAVVTHGGGKKLEEPLVVRPTSETIIGHMYAKWIKSYRDLPVLINQWANVVRWELRTRLFLRTMEFLWQEGHTAHATAEEAEEEARRMLDVYEDFLQNDAAIPVVKGQKSNIEKFAGALRSYTVEAMMGNTWALQSGTSHNLGQNFAKAFNIRYLDRNNELQYVWTTSWGMSTRVVGAVVMVHGDDQGLRLPPRLAPIQVVVVPIWRKDADKSPVLDAAYNLTRALREAGVRVHLDDREEHTPGFKFNEWELRGVPLRVEIGPRDVENRQVVLARRDIPGKAGKSAVPMDEIVPRVQEMLETIQQSLFDQAKAFMEANTHTVQTYEEFKEVLATRGGFIRVYWAGSDEDEIRIKEETKATIRCYPFDHDGSEGTCFYTGKKTNRVAIFARAY
ncbi:MAG: proline--tRNA ligase [Chloroflexi bacterium]|nr:proline--tRNA ligase [Chloroflexota bacterium]